ncbi:hypothetical protein [Moorena sp. SIO3H5]|uniref:hypothetical protein n=1 Tax=Moorena sp. SIO3H5 TaxID=2607834 RepID=UPI0013B8E76D|nr:hypothetical protein [Moorena sp. SIO3H5]NEO72868.1 hypothetical protein [Moorena sp. SIO3H5]
MRIVTAKVFWGEVRRISKGHIHIAPITPGNLQVHWPEGNVLLDKGKRSPEVDIPDYNALVRLEKV